MTKTLIAKIVFGGALIASASFAQAQMLDPSGPKAGAVRDSGVSPHAIQRTAIRPKQLVDTWIAEGKVFANYNAGDIAIDSARNIKCPSSPAGQCTLEVIVNVGVSDIDVATGSFWMCTKLDGGYVGTCPFLGETRSTDQNTTSSSGANFYNVRTASMLQTGIAVGSHSVQALVRLEKSSSIGRYGVTYRLYK